MFNIVDRHKRLVQVIMALIVLPFAFFGVDSYFRQDGLTQSVATVGGDKITQQLFNQTLAEQQQRMRAQLGASFDPAMMDNPELRFAVLEQLISRQLLQGKAMQEAFRVPDAQLQQYIVGVPAFRDNGQFSPERYRQVLASQNLTPAAFEDQLRRDLLIAPLQEPMSLGTIVAGATGERFLRLQEEQREVQTAAVDPEPYLADIKIDDAAVKAFYDANAALLQTPEQAKVEYLTLTLDDLMAKMPVDASEVKAAYERNMTQYTKSEEREAAHILIAVKPGASEDERAAAKAKAQDLMAKTIANPEKFGELAKEFSQDPGSAAQGGDLGSFARGNMVKPFDDAVFAMKVGDIVGPITTDFGYHVIKLSGIAPAKVRPFDEVKAQIETDVKRNRSAQKFASSADQLQNLVYEQADSLQGAATTLGLTVETSPPMTRAQVQALAKGNAKFVAALFSPESTQSKRNTEAIEVAPSTLMAGRIVEYIPAAPRAFADVQDEIRRQLVRKAAGEIAQRVGREKLQLLEQGKSDKDAGVTFAPQVSLTRNEVKPGYPPDALKRIFQLDGAKVPLYTGMPNERGGFSIYKLEKVVDPPAPELAKLTAANARIGEQLSRELLSAYIASLKEKADVKINQTNLEKR